MGRRKPKKPPPKSGDDPNSSTSTEISNKNVTPPLSEDNHGNSPSRLKQKPSVSPEGGNANSTEKPQPNRLPKSMKTASTNKVGNGSKKIRYQALNSAINSELQDSETPATFNRRDPSKGRSLLSVNLALQKITKMFPRATELDRKLENRSLFQMPQMYKSFFEGRIQSDLDKLVEKNRRPKVGYVRDYLRQYEIPALKACFEEKDFEKLKLNLEADEVKKFFQELKTEGDRHGIIQCVTEDDRVIFCHRTYAEYFAAEWLRRNLDKIGPLRHTIFNYMHDNLRLMFDIMLAEDHPSLLAVIYKKPNELRNHLIASEDEAGRTLFHLAFSYDQRYNETPKRESPGPVQMIEGYLNQSKLLKKKDKIFGFDCVDYAFHSNCFYPIEKLMEARKLSFYKVKKMLKRVKEDRQTLAKAFAQLGYPNLLSALLKIDSSLRKDVINFMELAIRGCNGDVCTFVSSRPGNVGVVKMLTSWIDLKGSTILEYACRERSYDVLEILIENHATCSEGNTILHFLVRNCSKDYRKELLTAIKKFNIDINKKNDDGVTALHEAVECANVKIVEMLMDNGADFQSLDNDGRSAWHYAISRSREDIIELFLTRKGISVNDQNQDGSTPLHFASKEGKTDIIKMFLERGAKPELTDNAKNNSLHYAVEATRVTPEAIRLLVKSGVDPNAKNRDGLTPLCLANKKGDLKAAEILLENGATEEFNSDSEGRTLLHVACQEHRREDVIKLLKRGADPNIFDSDDRNALHYYLIDGYPEDVVRAMIDHGLNLNIRYTEGRTLLHIVCSQGDTQTVRKLIEKEVRLNVTNDDRRNVLHVLLKSLQATELMVKDRLINRDKFGHEHDSNTLHFGCESCYHQLLETVPLPEDEDFKDKLSTIVKDEALIEILQKLKYVDSNESKRLFIVVRIIVLEMIRYFVENNIGTKNIDNFGKTALDYASELETDYPEIMYILSKNN